MAFSYIYFTFSIRIKKSIRIESGGRRKEFAASHLLPA